MQVSDTVVRLVFMLTSHRYFSENPETSEEKLDEPVRGGDDDHEEDGS